MFIGPLLDTPSLLRFQVMSFPSDYRSAIQISVVVVVVVSLLLQSDVSQPGSVQFKMASMRSEKPHMRSTRSLSDDFPALPFETVPIFV